MIGSEQVSLIPAFQLMTGAPPEGSPKRAEHADRGLGATTRKVAVVEDQLVVAWTIESMLQDLGHEVVGIYSSGEEAVAALPDVQVDLVCMDINLGPGIDGIEATRRIREQQQSVAVIFITAYSDAATMARIQKAAPDAVVIGKPTTVTKLENAFGQVPPSVT